MKPQGLRVLYASGPGDIVRTFRTFQKKSDDDFEVARPYSAQFFELCERKQLDAWAISSHAGAQKLEEGTLYIEHRPRPLSTAGGWLFHLGEARYALGLVWSAIRFRADAAVLAGRLHWWWFAPLRLFGIHVIPSVHRLFWAPGRRPRSGLQRVLQALNAWFWRRVPTATLVVSPECERQLHELAGDPRGSFHCVMAQYRREWFASLPAPQAPENSPLRILYAGRLEQQKGVFDLISIALRLQQLQPGDFAWELCGDGPERAELEHEIERAGLQQCVRLRGHLARMAMLEAFGRAHVVIVPTIVAEGLNKVAIEAILAGRPVVSNRLTPALELLGEAAIEVPPQDLAAYADALRRLATDAQFYRQKCQACLQAQPPFVDPSRGWGATLEEILSSLE